MVMVKKGRILKVTIEYEGVTYINEGGDAERWLQWVENIEFLANALGRFSNINWTKIEEHDAESDNKE